MSAGNGTAVSERSLLAALTCASDETVAEVAALVDARMFSSDPHRIVYELLLESWRESKPRDLALVRDALSERAQLAEVGGERAIAGLWQYGPKIENALDYAQAVRQASQRRRLAALYADMTTRLHAGDNTNEVLQTTAVELAAIRDLSSADKEKSLFDIVSERVHRMQSEEPAGRIDTFTELDACIGGGLALGRIYVVAARSGVGKSTMASELALRCGQRNRRVVYFALEVESGTLVDGMLASVGRVDRQLIDRRLRGSTEADIRSFIDSAHAISALPITIVDRASITIEEVWTRAKTEIARHGPLGVVVIDYLQQLKPSERGVTREQQVAHFSRMTRVIAKECQCAVVSCVQLNRDVDKREDCSPRISDIRESTQIENDADVVLLLHSEERVNPNTTRKGILDVMIAKNKCGPTQSFALRFHKPWTRIEDWGAMP